MLQLKYTPGAIPGKATKRPISEDERTSAKKNYETKRTRSFQPSWQNNFHWLLYNNESGKMFCTFCIKSSNECVFTTGCSNFKLETLKAHQESRGHQRATAEHQAKSAPTHSKTSEAANCLLKLKQNEYDKLVIKFRTAHALAKSHQSFNFFNTICRLDKAKGLDVGKSYLNDKAAASFTKAIADVTRQEVLQNLRKSPFFSFTIDGATDFTGEDLENIYVRTSIQGSIQDTFLYIGSAESATSADIHTLILNVFKEYGISDVFERKLVGFCADGASNMQGLKSGLAALIRKQQPYCIITHCLAHRLELAFKDAIKASSTSKLYDKTLTLLIGLYYLYRRSPKMKKQLKNAFSTMEIKQVLPTRIGGTRWLPHMERAINAFLSGYRAIRAQLETGSHNNPKAEGLAKLASDGDVIIYILLLKSVVRHLQKLSKYLQTTGLSLADAYNRVAATKTVLLNIMDRDDEAASSVVETKEFQCEKVRFRGKPSSPSNAKLTKSIIQAIDKRYPETSPIIQATQISAFESWPVPGSQEISDFGDKEVFTIVNYFSTQLQNAAKDVTMDDYMDEWKILRSLVYSRYPTELHSGTLTLRTVLKGLASQKLSNVTRMLDLICSLPPTSVKNETTFSTMKLIKTKRRGRLNDDTLNDLTVVVLESPDIERFNPEPAIRYWMITPSGRRRRLEYERAATLQRHVPDTSVDLVAEVQVSQEVSQESQEVSQESQEVSQESQEVSQESQVSQEVSQQEVQEVYTAFQLDNDKDDGYSSDESCDLSEDFVSSMIEMFSRD